MGASSWCLGPKGREGISEIPNHNKGGKNKLTSGFLGHLGIVNMSLLGDFKRQLFDRCLDLNMIFST